jgi:hypothetical protein
MLAMAFSYFTGLIQKLLSKLFSKDTDLNSGSVTVLTRTVYPDVIFNHNQQRAYIILQNKKPLNEFNSYASKHLSLEERDNVLNHVKLSDLA